MSKVGGSKMRIRKFFLWFSIASIFFWTPKVEALTTGEIERRNECGDNMFEVAIASSNGSATKVACYNDYNEALNAMNQGDNNSILFQRTGGVTNLVNAKYGLLDLTVTNQESGLTYYYPDPGRTTSSNNYMNNKASYGATDGALISVNWTNDPENHRMAQLKVAGYSGWMNYHTNFSGYQTTDYQIVPLAWVKSSSYYTVSSTGNNGHGSITHCYTASILQDGTASCRTIGPKPEQLAPGTYYSYDGKYFYQNRMTMLEDYKAGNFNQAANANNPYYNYYLYLPAHSKSTYSGSQIDTYTRNVAGYDMLAYGAPAAANASLHYGKGIFFTNAQEYYGVNALLMYGISRNESGNGRSNTVLYNRNGFSMNAYDSNPGGADVFARFEDSIKAFAALWATYGYIDPNDWRYNGASIGHKGIGMNIKYASDPFWGEKAAAFYNSFDANGGYQDYNHYQLGVLTSAGVNARTGPGTGYRSAYRYKQADDPVIIVGERTDSNGHLWYQVVSDMNLDPNGNEISCGDKYNCPAYRYDSSYVYVSSDYIRKVNTAKKGYQAPTGVYNYKDNSYSYHFYEDGSREDPRVAKMTGTTNYYYDSALQNKKNVTVEAGRYVMVYAEAKDASGNIVSYLVTADYNYDQEEWVPADKLQIVGGHYGRDIVDTRGHYTNVRQNPDESSSRVGRLYDDTYIPILDQRTDNQGRLWYQTQTTLSGNNVLGWVLADDGDTRVIFYQGASVVNNPPVITASDKTLVEKSKYNLLDGVKATDKEDGDLTSSIQVTTNLDINKVGTYQATYQVSDKLGQTTTKAVQIYVIADEVPVIQAVDQEVVINTTFDPLKGVTAIDKEDGTLKVTVIANNVNTKEEGDYLVKYQVVDSYGHKVEKQIKVVVTGRAKKDGDFYYQSLKEENGKLILTGFQTIKGMNNTLKENINYVLVFTNEDTLEEKTQKLVRISDKGKMPFEIEGEQGFDYTYAWFEGEVNVDDLPLGNYSLSIRAMADSVYSENVVSNVFGFEMVSGYQGTKRHVMIRNNYESRSAPVQLFVREKALGEKTVSSRYNLGNEYSSIKFVGNNLIIRGASHSIGGDYSPKTEVTRKLILENTKTFQRNEYDIGSITNGDYTIELRVSDGKDKTRAWFETTNVDVSSLEKGTYVIYIATKSNVSDYGELQDIFNNKIKATTTINGKNYSLQVNKEKRYRIELKVS